MEKKIIVIGGGPAGIEAAKTAASAGGQVTLITNGPIGGRAGWHSLLPSKVWLSAADALGFVEEAGVLGVAAETAVSHPAQITERIQQITQSWNEAQAEQLRLLDVEIVTGTAVFSGANSVIVESEEGQMQELQGDAIIVATGSNPVFPSGMRPDGKRILAPRFAKAMKTLPKSIIVVGGGVTGSEFVYLFNRMGVAVTWIVDQFGVLPAFHPAAAQALAESLVAKGVYIVFGEAASRIDVQEDGIRVVLEEGATYDAEMAFLAIGRAGDVDGLHLEAAGVTDFMILNDYGRYPDLPIYMVGDVTGPPMVANSAMAQARVAALDAMGVEGIRPYQPQTVITATYTDPQVAQVGDVGRGNAEVRVEYTAVLKTSLLPHSGGFLILTYNSENRVVQGAAAFGHHAADLLAPVAVAIQQEATVDDLAAIYPAHPTLSELAFAAARTVL